MKEKICFYITLFGTSGIAPDFRSKETISSCLLKQARCKGVLPSWQKKRSTMHSFLLISIGATWITSCWTFIMAPFSINSLAMLELSFWLAPWSGVAWFCRKWYWPLVTSHCNHIIKFRGCAYFKWKVYLSSIVKQKVHDPYKTISTCSVQTWCIYLHDKPSNTLYYSLL